MSDLIDRDAAMKLRDTLADIIGAAPMSSIHSALSEYRKAIRALPAVEVGVTPLSFDQREPSFHAAGCVIGMYYIIESDGMIDPFKLERPGWLSIIGFPTLEAAKSAAQADYAARIRSALTVTPAPDVGNVQALVDALEFYADRDNYEPVYERMPCDCCTDIYEPVKRDEGDTARAALAAWKEGK